MKKSYVGWITVLVGLTLVSNAWACNSSGSLEGIDMPDTTIVMNRNDSALSYSGEYVCVSDSTSGVLKVYGPTPSEEIMFSLIITTSEGCVLDRTGRARLVGKTKAVYYVVNTNCQIELLFVDGQVRVLQNQCPERDSLKCGFDGVYLLASE